MIESGPDLERGLGRATEALMAAPSVALACHINPDPDAIGSMLGLALYLASQGKAVVCSWGNQPLKMPRWMAAMEGAGFVVEARAFPWKKSSSASVSMDG